ncbi:MAG TPA: DNA-directed RNA polymerase subunit alpha [Candidatus Bathyarchaeia archaeon]|nr:DNA-directed RNA polymerase subunit alpha [Candidatus Bathyarchaeia archaeon]
MLEPIFTIKAEKEVEGFAKFSIEPLEQGYGHTLGNAIRRVLLSSIPGAAVTQVKIKGVKHRFSTLEGLREDIIELILNIKNIRLVYEGKKPEKITLEKTGPGEIRASDITTPATVKIVNPELVIGYLASAQNTIKAELTVERGFGYLPAEGRASNVLGLIPIDAVFSPVLSVNYKVESTRVGRRTDLDQLILEITTDKTVSPSETLKMAAKILIDFFKQVVNPKKPPKEEREEKPVFSELLNLTVEELNLPTRIANALRRGGFGTLSDLIQAPLENLLKVKNLGEKSIKIISAALDEKGFSLKKG